MGDPFWEKYYKGRSYNLFTAILAILGDKCIRCGFADRRALHVDHINGGGTERRRGKNIVTYRTEILNELVAGSQEYQILCANCNYIKRAENKECDFKNWKRRKLKESI